MYYPRKEAEINKALRLLEEAAREKEEERRRALNPRFSPLMMSVASNSLNEVTRFYKRLENIVSDGQTVAMSVLTKLQKQVEDDPWGFLRNVVAISFGFGLMLGHHSKDLRMGRGNAKNLNELLI